MEIEPVAIFKSDFKEKFGIPRQAGLAPNLKGRIVFQGKYAAPQALRGLEGFDYLWIIWGFSEAAGQQEPFKATVRPPRLGGNKRIGVFASRSPFRPNSLALSSVRIESIGPGAVINVLGADLMDGTPIYDIKPYVAYADSFPQARSGFAQEAPAALLEVVIPDGLDLDSHQREVLCEVLSLDPRPAYQHDAGRVYGMPFFGKDVHFRVEDNVLTVIDYA